MRKLWKKGLAMVLVATVCLTTGCGGQSASEDSVSANNGKGRYVESQLELDSLSGWCSQIYTCNDKEFEIYDFSYNQILKSREGGTKWDVVPVTCFDEVGYDNIYVDRIALGPNGEILAEYMLNDELTNDVIQPILLYSDAEGNVKQADFGRSDLMVGKLAFGKDGTPYMCDSDDTVYQLDFENETKKALYTTEARPIAFEICGNLCVTLSELGAQIYDLENQTLLEEQTVLEDMLTELNVNTPDASVMYENIYFADDSDANAFYFITSQGIYRYVTGGSSVEQLMDGNLSSLRSPSNMVNGLAVTEDKKFLVLASESGLLQFQYDPEAASVPDVNLKVYSLYANATLQQTISDFQREHSDVYVTYEIGIPQDSGITYEDAVKNLNTEILAGTGPDVILMDNLSVNNYIEKGLLVNLQESDAWKPTEPLFDNIINSMVSEDGLYTVPAKISIPTIYGHLPKTTMNTLADLADQVELLHEEEPEKDVLQCNRAETLLYTLFLLDPSCIGNDQEVTRDEVVELLNQAKRIYDIQLEVRPSYYSQMTEEDLDYELMYAEENAESIVSSCPNVAIDEAIMGAGVIDGASYDFQFLPSAQRIDSDFTYIGGMDGAIQYYIPSCMLSICTTSTQQEVAMQFINAALSKTVQSVELGDGLPVNQDALHSICTPGETEDEICGSMAWDDEDGNMICFDVYSLSTEEWENLETMIQTVTTPIRQDQVVKDTIIELAPDYIYGNSDIDETADQIMETLEIRLAE